MSYDRPVEEEDYERHLNRVLYYYRLQTDDGDLLLSNFHSSMDLVCFDYPFPDSWCVNCMDRFRPFLDFDHRARERRNSLRVLANWQCEGFFAISSTRR